MASAIRSLITNFPGGIVCCPSSPEFTLQYDSIAKLLLGQFVSPIPEGPFRKLHNIPLVNQGNTLLPMGKGILNGHSNKTFGAKGTDRLDSNPRTFTDFLPQLLLKELYDPHCLFGPCLPLNSRIDIFGVFPEDNHVYLFRMFHGAWSPGKIPDWPDAGVEVEPLPEQNIDAPNSPSNRSGEWPLDTDLIFPNRLDRLLRSPFPF